jgi:hypothetical protein
MAGQHLADRLVPEFQLINNELNALNDLRHADGDAAHHSN